MTVSNRTHQGTDVGVALPFSIERSRRQRWTLLTSSRDSHPSWVHASDAEVNFGHFKMTLAAKFWASWSRLASAAVQLLQTREQ